jgi:polyhydroxyalkanoate synthesis regulator phasin
MSVLKNTILASIGVINVTKAKAEQIIDDLIKKGELDRSDRKKAVMELLDKAEKSTADWKAKFSKGADKTQKEFQKIVKSLNVAKQTDLKKLETKVDRLNKSIKALEKKLDQA